MEGNSEKRNLCFEFLYVGAQQNIKVTNHVEINLRLTATLHVPEQVLTR